MRFSKKVLLSIIFLALLASGIYVFLTRDESASLPRIATSPFSTGPSPTPFPFQELTVPYLRERTYHSSFGNLNQASENQDYTAYLTSYLSDGLRVNGLLTRPKGEMPSGGWPAIIFIHGYIPPANYDTLSQYSSYVDFLARNGFVVFKIDLRGHGDSEGSPSGAYYSSDYIVDTLNAYSALQNSTFVNRDKIGLWGHSMAGNVAMRSFAAKPTIPGVVIWAGAVYSYTDWTKLGIRDSSYQPPGMNNDRVRKRRELLEKYGSPSAESNFWHQVAPTSFLADLEGSIEIHHAVDDNVVDIEYSRGLAQLLDKTSVPHQLFEYSTGGHNISGASFNIAMQRTVEFFRRNL